MQALRLPPLRLRSGQALCKHAKDGAPFFLMVSGRLTACATRPTRLLFEMNRRHMEKKLSCLGLKRGPASMEIDYELTQDDFIESFTAHRNRNVFIKWLIRLLMSFAIVVAVFLALGLAARPSAQETKDLLPFFGLVRSRLQHRPECWCRQQVSQEQLSRTTRLASRGQYR